MSATIPLPVGRPDTLDDKQRANRGLLYEKYVDAWDLPTLSASRSPGSADRSRSKELERARFYRRIVRSPDAVDETEGQLQSYLKRRHRLLDSLGGDVMFGTTVWRFAAGLGALHPLETGFTWHRTLGVPYVPGSSIKGMMRSYVRHWLNDEPLAAELFGSAEPDSPHFGMGKVIVFDAIPGSWPRLQVDIINPHYPEYYRDGTRRVQPSDDQQPVPVNFVTVAAGQRFEFALAPAFPDADRSTVDLAFDILRDAAQTIALGAKTAVGYGVFSMTRPQGQQNPLETLKAERREHEMASMSEFERLMLPVRELLALYRADASKIERDPRPNPMLTLFQKLDDFSAEEQRAAAKLLDEIWRLMGLIPARRSQRKSKDREERIQQILSGEER